jgi:hypothetical protein
MRRLDRERKVTRPERTPIDGFSQLDLDGGHAELIESAAGFSVLEIPLFFQTSRRNRAKSIMGRGRLVS